MPHTDVARAITRAQAFSFCFARHARQLTGWWQPRLLFVAILMVIGLAVLMRNVLAFEGPEGLEQSRATNDRTLAEFPIWRRVTIGSYKGVSAIRDAFDAARMRIGDSADEILGRPAFPFSSSKTELDLVVITAADLGFAPGSIAVAEIYRRALQLGLELCPAETGPQLRLQYVNQPVGEFLHIAMHPVATYQGDLVDLTVANGGAGLLLLGGDGSPDLKLHSSVKFVFVRPARIAMPNTR
jgi:hypothetical protein